MRPEFKIYCLFGVWVCVCESSSMRVCVCVMRVSVGGWEMNSSHIKPNPHLPFMLCVRGAIVVSIYRCRSHRGFLCAARKIIISVMKPICVCSGIPTALSMK